MSCPLQGTVLHYSGGDANAAFSTLYIVYVVNALIYAEMFGFIPYVRLDEQRNNIAVSSTTNWDSFFQPVSSFEPACGATRIIDPPQSFWYPRVHSLEPWAVRGWYYGSSDALPRDRRAYDAAWYSERRAKGARLFQKYIRLKSGIKHEFDDTWLRLWGKADHVLGVHMRGTDKAAGRRKVAFEEYRPYIEQYLAKHNNSVVYIATDSKFYLKRTVKSFGRRVVYNLALRSGGKKPVFEMDRNTTRSNLSVLEDIYLLSKCDFFLHSASALAESVIYMNPRLIENSIHLEYLRKRQTPGWLNPSAHKSSLKFAKDTKGLDQREGGKLSRKYERFDWESGHANNVIVRD